MPKKTVGDNTRAEATRRLQSAIEAGLAAGDYAHARRSARELLALASDAAGRSAAEAALAALSPDSAAWAAGALTLGLNVLAWVLVL